MSGFIIIKNGEDGVNVELKVTYNSVGVTAEQLQKAVVGILPGTYMEIEKQLGALDGG